MQNKKIFMNSRSLFTKMQVIYILINSLLSLILMILLREQSVTLWLVSFSLVLSLSFFESLYHQELSRKQKVVIFIFTMCVISVAYIIGEKLTNQLFNFWILYYFFQQFIGTVGGIFFTYLLNKSE